MDLYRLVTQYDRTGYINRQVFTWKQVGDHLELTNTETGGSWDFKYKDVGQYDKFTFYGESFNKTTDTTAVRSYLLGEWQFAGLEMSDTLIDGGFVPNTMVFQDDYTFTMNASALSNDQEIHGTYLVANHGVYLYMPELKLITSIDFGADLKTFRFNFGFGTGIDLYYVRDPEILSKIGLDRNLIGTYWTGSNWFGSEVENQVGIYFVDEHYATLVINKRTSKKEVVSSGSASPSYNTIAPSTISRMPLMASTVKFR